MEKKKLLLVSVSTGIFLMLVLGASILIFSPRTGSPSASREVIPPGNSTAEVAAVTEPDLTVSAAGESEADPVPVVTIIAEPVEVAAPVVKIETRTVEEPKAEPVQRPVAVATPAAVTVQKPVAAVAAPVSKPAPKPAAAYWVQAGSYTMKSGADKAKASLSERGLVSVIFDSEVQGKTYYRVRIGPYVSQAEADYWLRLVKAIDGYEKSQVWKSGT
ncbi:MAG: SPOR domain-containing protein [Spirochaetaceae bacterium]|nr:SPOR domain-containing protein [Spirochaetaceae bacterium]